MKRFLLLIFLATPLFAQDHVASTSAGTLVAHDGLLELFADTGERKWSVDGVTYAGQIVHNDAEAVVLDPLADSMTVVDLKTGVARHLPTCTTPIDGAYVRGKLFVLCRDDQRLVRGDGTKLELDVPADLLRARGGRIYLYSRVTGVLLDIDPESMTVTQKAEVKPFAVDFDLDDQHLYFIDPITTELRTYSRSELKSLGQLRVGSRPIDVAIAADPTPLTARRLAVADVAHKQVRIVEAWQSTAKAVARGFLRGVLGFAVDHRGRDTGIDHGVDRVATRGGHTVAFESLAGTLWLAQLKPKVIATGVAPGAWALTPAGVVWWDGKVLQRHTF